MSENENASSSSSSGSGCCILVLLVVFGLFGELTWDVHTALGWPLLLAGAAVVVGVLLVGELLD